MPRFFPPSLPEWHASIAGFGVGFAFGASGADSGVVTAALAVARDVEGTTGHIAQARREAAYAAACFVVGAFVGRAWSRRKC